MLMEAGLAQKDAISNCSNLQSFFASRTCVEGHIENRLSYTHLMKTKEETIDTIRIHG